MLKDIIAMHQDPDKVHTITIAACLLIALEPTLDPAEAVKDAAQVYQEAKEIVEG